MSPGQARRHPLDKPVLFVVGSGRSGTTLLYELLCASPSAAWLSNWSQRWPALGRLHPSSPMGYKEHGERRWVPRPVEGYRVFDRVRDQRASSPSVDGSLTAVDLTERERRALRRAVEAHLAPSRVHYFVSKNTRNTSRVGYLAAAFPEAKFVHLVRHPCASIASLVRVAFFPELPVFWRDGASVADWVARGERAEVLAAELWVLETRSCRHALNDLPPDRKLEVRYESFVEDPVDAITSVLGLIGQSIDPPIRELIERRGISNRNPRNPTGLSSQEQGAVWELVRTEAAAHGYLAK